MENQEPLHVSSMSVGCGTVAVKLQPCHSQLTLHARNLPIAICAAPPEDEQVMQPCQSKLTLYACSLPIVICVAPPEDEQVMLETRRGSWFSINWMKSTSCWFYYTDILWRTVSKILRRHNVGTLPLWNPNLIINSRNGEQRIHTGFPYFCVYIMNFRCTNFAFRKKNCDMSVYLIISYTACFFPDGHNTTLFHSRLPLMYLFHSISLVFISLLWCLVLFEFKFVSAASLEYLLLPLPVYSLSGFTFVNFPSKIQKFRVVDFISHCLEVCPTFESYAVYGLVVSLRLL
jgi:hypothetical protein